MVDERGKLLNLKVTPDNTDDRQPVPDLLKSLFGEVFADRGYVSQALRVQLLQDFHVDFLANLVTYLYQASLSEQERT